MGFGAWQELQAAATAQSPLSADAAARMGVSDLVQYIPPEIPTLWTPTADLARELVAMGANNVLIIDVNNATGKKSGGSTTVQVDDRQFYQTDPAVINQLVDLNKQVNASLARLGEQGQKSPSERVVESGLSTLSTLALGALVLGAVWSFLRSS